MGVRAMSMSRIRQFMYNFACINQAVYWKNLYWFILADTGLTIYALSGTVIGFIGGYYPWIWLLFIPYTLIWTVICMKEGFVEKVIEPSLMREPLKRK